MVYTFFFIRSSKFWIEAGVSMSTSTSEPRTAGENLWQVHSQKSAIEGAVKGVLSQKKLQHLKMEQFLGPNLIEGQKKVFT